MERGKRQIWRAISAGNPWRWSVCLVLILGVSLSFAGCWGEINGDGYEFVFVDGGLPTSRRPPPTRRSVPDGTKPQPDQADKPDQSDVDTPGPGPDMNQAPVTYPDVYEALLKEFCVKCHDDKSARSRVGYYTHLTHDVIAKKKDAIAYWTYAWERIKQKQMPPVPPDADDEKQRLAAGLAVFERWAKAGFPKGNWQPPQQTKGTEDPYTVFPTSATCKGNQPMPSRLWRLTTEQVRNSILDIFGSGLTLPDFSLSSKRVGGVTNNANESGLDNVDVTTLVKKFEEVSKEVFAKTARWKTCLAATGTTCVKQLIAQDGRMLWRRSLTQAEIDKLIKGFDTLKVDSRESALAFVLERMLLSSNFLFRSELGTPEPGKAGIRRLSHHEVAAFLSYSLWQSSPDDALLKAAEEKRLGTPTDVSKEIDRMLKDPKAKRGLSEFFKDWLHIRELLVQEKDASVFKGLTTQLRKDVIASATRFLEFIAWEQKGTIADLFKSDTAFVNESVAKLLTGVSATGGTFKQVKLDGSRRAGILTTPAFLMAQAGKDTTGFVHRGVFFLEELLCRPVGDPPMGAVAAGLARVANTDTSKMTQREIMEKLHSADDSCNSCHRKIDPIGAAFEIFSPLGQFRTSEKGKTIDASGKLEGFGDMKPAFKDSVELIKNLADSEHFKQCMTLKLYTHLWGHVPEGQRNCGIAALYEHIKGKQFQLLNMHKALLDDKQFFLRAEPTTKKDD